MYDRLREDILMGRLAPGTPLSQSAIAKQVGTSRSPVNEALRRLQQDRLVVGRANQRFSVSPFGIADLEAIFCLHLANNALAVLISVPFLTDADIRLLEEGIEILDNAYEKDAEAWDRGYQKFLFTLISHASARSIELAYQLIDEMRRYRAIWPNFRRVWLKASDFTDLMDAARARNGKQASIYYATALGRMASLVMVGAEPTYDAFRLRRYIVTMAQGITPE